MAGEVRADFVVFGVVVGRFDGVEVVGAVEAGAGVEEVVAVAFRCAIA